MPNFTGERRKEGPRERFFPPKLPGGDANNYFSLAVFRPDEAGQYRRQKARFQALLAVMLDDMGSKVAMERLRSSAWKKTT